jgi:hypothetical protein
MGALFFTAAPSVAADSLQISSPLSGTTVSGDVLVTGSIVSDEAVSVAVGMAAQVLGDCGPVEVVDTQTLATGGDFTAVIPTALIENGRYCLLAMADSGRLSTVIGDVTIDNVATEGFQLPTEAFGDDQPMIEDTAMSEVPSQAGVLDPFSSVAVFGPIMLAASALLTAIVVVFALVQRRRAS